MIETIGAQLGTKILEAAFIEVGGLLVARGVMAVAKRIFGSDNEVKPSEGLILG